MSYLLFGNINTIDCVSIVPNNFDLGRNHENDSLKLRELSKAYDFDVDFGEIGGYSFKECCYSLGGVIADKVVFDMDYIPYENSDEDTISLYSFLGMVLSEDEIDRLREAATPSTEELIKNNVELIKQVASALVSAPNQQLDNQALLELLSSPSR